MQKIRNIQSRTATEEFRDRADRALLRIATAQQETEQSKLVRFKSSLRSLSESEQMLQGQRKQCEAHYDCLLRQVAELREELQWEGHEEQKARRQIEIKIEIAFKQKQKIFDNIRQKRVYTKKILENYVQNKMDKLSLKGSFYNASGVPLEEYQAELDKQMSQINKFCIQSEIEQQKAQKQIFLLLQESINKIKKADIDNFQIEFISLLKSVEYDISERLAKLETERQQIEQRFITYLERINSNPRNNVRKCLLSNQNY